MSEAQVHPEIVIVRRGHGGHDDGHHGGVWKIAYADFMTAMMAFFLVMWLINAANEATRAQVASYFNPVKLTDSVTSDKGLTKPKNKSKKEKKDSEEQPKPEEEEKKESQDKAEQEKEGESEKKRAAEDRLFKDPYVVLAELAGEAQQGSPAGDANAGAATEEGGNAGLRDGEAYRDPFDPQAWRDLPVPQPEGEPGGKPEPAKPPEAKPEPKPEEKMAEAPPEKIEPPQVKKPEEKKAEEKKLEAAAELANKIKDAVGGTGAGGAPELSVEVTEEGVLISLTDTVEFGMFTVGSAQPKAEVIAIMEKIAGLIKAEPGQVVLRGHTDARPYKSERYDNWRLSSARAQMAYYMLTRAGLDPARVAQIEGHADRMLKREGEPFAAENRRIEILLRKAKL